MARENAALTSRLVSCVSCCISGGRSESSLRARLSSDSCFNWCSALLGIHRRRLGSDAEEWTARRPLFSRESRRSSGSPLSASGHAVILLELRSRSVSRGIAPLGEALKLRSRFPRRFSRRSCGRPGSSSTSA